MDKSSNQLIKLKLGDLISFRLDNEMKQKIKGTIHKIKVKDGKKTKYTIVQNNGEELVIRGLESFQTINVQEVKKMKDKKEEKDTKDKVKDKELCLRANVTVGDDKLMIKKENKKRKLTSTPANEAHQKTPKHQHQQDDCPLLLSSPFALCPRQPLPDVRYILAPMVGASELPFRLLCRRYGASIAYTPMINSERFSIDEKYREQEFQCTPEDRPLVCHFAANDPQTFLKAAKFVEDRCDAIDLNLGCPQRVACQGHYGSFLLDDCDRDLVLSMVRTVSQNIKIPLFVKIRLLSTLDDTITLVGQLRDAGASLVAIHARHRVNLTQRSGPGARDGAALLDQVTEIKKVINGFPIIANGNIITFDDVKANFNFTNADGVMSAEGILDDPALFAEAIGARGGRISGDLSKEYDRRISLALEYLALAKEYPTSLKTMIFHIRRMSKEVLLKYQLLDECLNATSLDVLQSVCDRAQLYLRDSNLFVFDKDKESREKVALERKKYEEGKRKRYEERMQRKAKREGKPLDFYIQDGLEPPSIDEIKNLKFLISKGQDMKKEWTDKFKQHCFAFHLEGKCPRDRACSFLHYDAKNEGTSAMESYG